MVKSVGSGTDNMQPSRTSTKEESKNLDGDLKKTHKDFKGFIPQRNILPSKSVAKGNREVGKLLTPKNVKDKPSLLQFLKSQYDYNLDQGSIAVINMSNRYFSKDGEDKFESLSNLDTFKKLLSGIAVTLSSPLKLLIKPCFAKMRDALDKKNNKKKIARYVFSSLLYKTFKRIDTTNINAKFWRIFAEDIDKSIKNVTEKDLNKITTTKAEEQFLKKGEIKNVEQQELSQVLVDITSDKIKAILKKFAKDKMYNSLYNQFFDPQGNLHGSFKDDISTTVEEIVVYTDSLGSMYHDDLKKEFGLDF